MKIDLTTFREIDGGFSLFDVVILLLAIILPVLIALVTGQIAWIF
jgi:hypothetical protein